MKKMKKGVTLIEILVASLILVIGLTSLMASFVFCLRINIRNSHRHNATNIINQHFEDIHRQESTFALNDYLTNPVHNLNRGVYISRKANYTVASQRYFLRIYDVGTAHPTPFTTLRVLEAAVTWSGDVVKPNPLDVITMRIISNQPNI